MDKFFIFFNKYLVNYNKYFIYYIVIINLIAIFITILDKQKAKKHKWRIKESTLFLFSALGGSVGMFLTMKSIRHKTKHKRFMLGIPIIFIIQSVLFFYVWWRILNV